MVENWASTISDKLVNVNSKYGILQLIQWGFHFFRHPWGIFSTSGSGRVLKFARTLGTPDVNPHTKLQVSSLLGSSQWPPETVPRVKSPPPGNFLHPWGQEGVKIRTRDPREATAYQISGPYLSPFSNFTPGNWYDTRTNKRMNRLCTANSICFSSSRQKHNNSIRVLLWCVTFVSWHVHNYVFASTLPLFLCHITFVFVFT
jgi:hypothetical protein